MTVHNIKIYNTLTNKKEKIVPIKNRRINLFVCGPTVYDYSHLGHARNYIIFDIFVKYLRHSGFNVFYLQNITNIDDKIIARARERKVSPESLALAFEKEYLKDMKLSGVDSINKYARATEYIKEITSQVKRLIAKGYAYKIDGDGIYYDISKFKKYGKLSRRTAIQAEDAVSRIDYSKDKKNRGDFCIWKFSEDENEPKWKTDLGQGRPGWHIEDTAITEKFFGSQYDLHGGARDLIFPHHEAEVSIMEAISGKSPMVKYWMHVGFLTVNGQKMSKSTGNFLTIADFLKRYSKQQLRFLVAKNLWSSPFDYSESTMIDVKATVEKIEEFLRRLREVKTIKLQDKQIKNKLQKAKVDFYNELDDDFNTPKAFVVLFDFIKEINKAIDNNEISKKTANNVYSFFEEINKVFDIIDFKKVKRTIPASIKKIVKDREKYRKEQNWQKSDELRLQLEKQGYQVEDTKDKTIVKKY